VTATVFFKSRYFARQNGEAFTLYGRGYVGRGDRRMGVSLQGEFVVRSFVAGGYVGDSHKYRPSSL